MVKENSASDVFILSRCEQLKHVAVGRSQAPLLLLLKSIDHSTDHRETLFKMHCGKVIACYFFCFGHSDTAVKWRDHCIVRYTE